MRLALLRVEGVEKVEVSYRAALARVRYDPAKTTPERLVEAVNRGTVFRAALRGVTPGAKSVQSEVKQGR